MTHICMVCFTPVEEHSERCDNGYDHFHFPALCCPGCPCGSYEHAHSTTEAERHYILDYETKFVMSGQDRIYYAVRCRCGWQDPKYHVSPESADVFWKRHVDRAPLAASREQTQ